MYVERLAGRGEAAARVSSGNASLTFRIEPGPPGLGGEYRMGTERGYLLPSFHRAIEETVPRVMACGPLGWRVVDWLVTMTDGRFSAPTPPAGYYRDLTERALRRALEQAGTLACEPVSAFEVEVPEESFTAVLHVLTAAGGTPDLPVFGSGRCTVTGTIPTAQVYGVERGLPELTGGRGFMVSEPSGYRPCDVPASSRPSARPRRP